MTERHVLYLFAGAASPVALRTTTGQHAGQGFEIVATTDLDRDGRRELVLHTHNWAAPVETLFAKIDGTALIQVGAWSCESHGLVLTR